MVGQYPQHLYPIVYSSCTSSALIATQQPAISCSTNLYLPPSTQTLLLPSAAFKSDLYMMRLFCSCLIPLSKTKIYARHCVSRWFMYHSFPSHALVLCLIGCACPRLSSRSENETPSPSPSPSSYVHCKLVNVPSKETWLLVGDVRAVYDASDYFAILHRRSLWDICWIFV